MNKRMIKLYEQALEFTYDNVSKEIWNTDNFHAIVAGKFAELIVRESLSVLKDMHLWQSVNNHNYPGAWHDAVDQSINTIKENFGVEE